MRFPTPARFLLTVQAGRLGSLVPARDSRCEAGRRGGKGVSGWPDYPVVSTSALSGQQASHYSTLGVLVLPCPSLGRINKPQRVTRQTQKQLHLIIKLFPRLSVNFPEGT